MPKEIIQFDQAMFESRLDRMVRKKVEQTIDLMLDAEVDEIANAARYERSGDRKAFPRRPLRPPPDRQGRQAEPSGPEAEGRGVPQQGDRALPAT